MSDMDRQELLGKRILQNCRNELYLDFPYLDGAFASLEYEADNSIITIGTDGEKIYFNLTLLLKQYIRVKMEKVIKLTSMMYLPANMQTLIPKQRLMLRIRKAHHSRQPVV